ncbi:uncharacterized protein LOC134816650 [Bolinopsis microptera]|uniref:uncharacterized protein LOC134816650 n=1 Tax=Bolinopsis microptera TaxID=2820187 RepID=UPI003079672F
MPFVKFKKRAEPKPKVVSKSPRVEKLRPKDTQSSGYVRPTEYVTQMNRKNALQLADQEVALQEVLHFLVQGLAYLLLILIICSFGFVTGLEYLSYPLLMRQLTCTEEWGTIYQSVLPSANLLANMIGSIVGGIAIDKIGRRPVFIVSALLAIVAELVSMISMETTLFIVARGLSSLIMGVLYITTLLYTIETCPAKHRLHSYFLHFLAQNAATTIVPLIISNSPVDGTTNIWPAVSNSVVVLLALGVIVGILYPEPSQSSKIRANTGSKFQNRFSVMQLENDDEIHAEPEFAMYTDMFYKGGKVVGCLLILLFFIGGLTSTSLYLSFPIIYNSNGVCTANEQYSKPCMEETASYATHVTSIDELVTVFGCSILGSVLAYIAVQRYGRKNSYRAPAAFRVVVIVSMVMCGSHRLMLSQVGLLVLFTNTMDFTLDLYCLELFAARSRATSFGLLKGLKFFGTAIAFLINPFILTYVPPDLLWSIYTVVGTILFGCSLGLRKDTFIMAINIEESTIDVGL